MTSRTPLLVGFLLAAPFAAAEELLLLTLAQGQAAMARVYGSSTAPGTTLTVMAGEQAIMQKSSGRDYQLKAQPGSWAWTQVQQVPTDTTYIVVTPHLEGEKISADISYSSKKGDKSLAYTGSISGQLGQWIPLVQSTGTHQSSGIKTYSSGQHQEQLSLKIERLPQ